MLVLEQLYFLFLPLDVLNAVSGSGVFFCHVMFPPHSIQFMRKRCQKWTGAHAALMLFVIILHLQEVCFFFVPLKCSNLCLCLAYVRSAYGISGSPGWDVCISMVRHLKFKFINHWSIFLFVCSAHARVSVQPAKCTLKSGSKTQFIDLVKQQSSRKLACETFLKMLFLRHSGKPLNIPSTNNSFLATTGGCPVSCGQSVCNDPCNCLMMALTSPCTSASLGAQVTGFPFWMHLFCGGFYLNHHVIRKNFGVPGSDMQSGCFEPVCCRIFIHAIPVIGTCLCCLYTVQSLENDRSIIAQAISSGAPRFMQNTEIEVELPSVIVNG